MTVANPRKKVVSAITVPEWLSGTGPESDVVISTRVRLARNLADHRFPFYATRAERKKTFEAIATVFASQKEFRSFALKNCNHLSPQEREMLLERRLISPDLLTVEGDRGVALEKTGQTAIMVNEEDHLRLNCIGSGFRADALWKTLTAIDDQLGGHLSFAYDSRRGFLTSCPTNSGTGLRVSFLIHLPGLVLTKAIDTVLLASSQMGISTRGFFGEHSEVVGNFFQLSNQATMGAREEEFLASTKKLIEEVATHERAARKRLIADARRELLDKMYRAWGILLYARTLTMTEYLNLTSALRLGLECGVFSEITLEQLNRTTITVMPAHLQQFCNRELVPDELDTVRADVVRQLFTPMPKPVKKRGSTTAGKSRAASVKRVE